MRPPAGDGKWALYNIKTEPVRVTTWQRIIARYWIR